MRARCASLRPADFPKYRGRGITVCERWQNSFDAFYADMGAPPVGMSLDRIDGDGPYSPDNCRWATPLTQSRNRRYVRQITFDGRTQLLTDWARELGLRVSTLSMRLNKYRWPLDRALRRK